MNTETQTRRRAILAFMLDRPGVLSKVSMLIRRKMYNVDTITVCRTRIEGISRMTLTLCENDDRKLQQVVKQIEKMTEVISAKSLDTDRSFWREVALVKFEAGENQLTDIEKRYTLEVLDRQNNDIVVGQIMGTSDRIDDFLKDLGEARIIDVSRSGLTALEM